MPDKCRNCYDLEYKLKQRDEQDDRRREAWDRQRLELEKTIKALREQLQGFDQHNRGLVMRLNHRDTLRTACEELTLVLSGAQMLLAKAITEYERGQRAERESELVPAR